jgi:microcystin-dependent protein
VTQNYAPGQVLTAAAVNAELAFPTGSMIPFAGASAPPQTISGVSAWLICDGAAVSRTTYAALFAALSETYGAGDGTTTFNLPDLRGRMPIGAGNEGAAANNTARNLGAKGGDTRMQTHTHVQNAHTHTQNAHGHDLGGGQSFGMSFGNNDGGFATFGAAVAVINQGTYQGPYSALANTATNQNTTATNQNAGSGSGENMPPFLVTNYIIKT